MNRLQQSGLIALFLLLAVAAAGSFLGRGKVTETSIDTSAVRLEPGSQAEEIDLVSRRERLTASDFRRAPQPDPLQALATNASLSEPRVISLDPADPATPPSASRTVPPAQTQPQPQPLPPRRVRVHDGDTLQRIARRELGDSDFWRLLATTNGIQDPRALRIGQELVLPSEAALNQSRGAMQPVNADRSSRPASASTPSTPATSGMTAATEHLVAQNETVSEISQRYYGTSKLWRHILSANDLSDPRELRAGQRLLIPPPPQ